jgi:hypothetical protein
MPCTHNFRKLFCGVATLSLAVAVAAPAQEPAGQRGGFMAGMQRAQGEVTAIAGATLTLKSEDGSVVQIVTTDNTRMMHANGRMGGERRGEGGQAPQPIKLTDIKVGDGVMAFGQLDAEHKTLHAAMLADTDAATLKAMKDNLGKTYISGKVTAIDMDKPSLTVERPDHVSQTIGFDEGTSFRRGRMGRGGSEGPAAPAGESITLADIKVGDNVAGQGALKNGVFVPTQLNVMTPRPPRPAAEPPKQ